MFLIYSSTSPRNVLRTGAFLACCCCLPAVLGGQSAVTSRDAAKLLPLLREPFSRQDTYPQDLKPKFNVTGPGLEVKINNQLRLILPVRISFDDVSNSYCRAAIFDPGKTRAELIPLPVDADRDSCQGMAKIAFIDINRDGVADLIFRVSLPWNKDPRKMAFEGAVYVSQPDSPVPYCYASDVSGVVQTNVTARNARGVIEAEVKRRGEKILNCSGE